MVDGQREEIVGGVEKIDMVCFQTAEVEASKVVAGIGDGDVSTSVSVTVSSALYFATVRESVPPLASIESTLMMSSAPNSTAERPAILMPESRRVTVSVDSRTRPSK